MQNNKAVDNPFPRKVDSDGKVFCSKCGKNIRVILNSPLCYDFMGLVCIGCGNHEDVSYVRILEVQKRNESER